MLVVCAGTATGVGKTWVGAAALGELRARGRTVSARKPAQSFDPNDSQPLDADVLGDATGEHGDEVCPVTRTYAVPMAPPMAAAALGRPVPSLQDLLDELTWPEPARDVCWVEAVGGPRSPLAGDGDTVDLTAALAPRKVVLVADAGLGAINAVRLSIDPFRQLGHDPIVLLNHFVADDDLHRRNAAWLQDQYITTLLSTSVLVEVLEQAL